MKKWLGIDNFKLTFAVLGPYIIRHWKAYTGLILIMVIQLILSLSFASFFGKITDAATHGNLQQLSQLTFLGIVLLSMIVSMGYLNTLFESRSIYGVKRDLKIALFKHTLLLRADAMTTIRIGDLISRFDNDLNQIENMLGSRFVNLLRYPLVYCCVFFYLFHINPTLSLISWGIAPVAIAGSMIFGVLLRRNSRQINNLAGENTQLVNQSLQGFQVIRSFVLQRIFFERYKKQNQDLFKLEQKNAQLRGLYYAGGELASGATFIASLCLGAYFVSTDKMTVGALITFITLVDYMVFPLTGAAGNWAFFQKAAGSIERIQEVLQLPLETKKFPSSQTGHQMANSHPLAIEFKNVTFSYKPDQPIISHFNLSVLAGKKTAIVGFSGAGKTTLFSLLLSLYQPQSGSICIDGQPINEIPLHQLRALIAHVPQEPMLFNGTIRENLLLGREKTNEEIEEAAKMASIDAFIHSLPDAYETKIGERGLILSGGQKQRLAIARALLKDAPILLLDEATSALDSQTEDKVKSALDQLMKNRTTLIIAHRLSTIKNADDIVVMENGKIVQNGTHRTLMAERGLYRSLHLMRDRDQEERIGLRQQPS